jgi:formate dehydrogenase
VSILTNTRIPTLIPRFIRTGCRVLERLQPFNCKELLYFDYNGLPAEAEKAIGSRRGADLKDFFSQCDLVTVNAPLHEGTKGLISQDLLKHFKKVCLLYDLLHDQS